MENTVHRAGKLYAIILTLILSCLLYPGTGFASELEVKTQQMQTALAQVQTLNMQVEAARMAHSQAAAATETAQTKLRNAKEAFNRAKENQAQAMKVIHLIAPEKMMSLTMEYQAANQALDAAEREANTVSIGHDEKKQTLDRLEGEKRQAEATVQSLKADLFDLKMQEPVWVEGYGEVTQSEDKTALQCRELALTFAKREALERGGKALIESLTRVEMLELKQDTVTVSSKAQIIGQDDSGDWGKVKKVVEGDTIKFVVKVRLQITATGTANPFRARLPQTVPASDTGYQAAASFQPTVPVKPVEPANRQVPQGMVYVEGGSFNMGNASGVTDEKPLHRVTLTGFYLGKYEVTFAEYDAFCEATKREKPTDFTKAGRGSRPVEVYWQAALEYCNWRSRQEGLTPAYSGSGDNVTCDFGASGYRLPTEAEWEYAAKGGQRSRSYKYSGGNDANAVGWHEKNSEKKIHPVGKKQPNELGLYDMSGNVAEWCWDWYNETYYLQGDQTDPTGPDAGTKRVIRGGFYNNSDFALRPPYRGSIDPKTSWGFRLLRPL